MRDIFIPVKAKFSPGHLPWVTFTDPEIDGKRRLLGAHIVGLCAGGMINEPAFRDVKR
ncbi:MAG TPA: hypothetical protein VF003_11875 [Pseudonocardiaceae bacterium]